MRVLLRTYSNSISAEMAAEKLRELDLPIVVMSGSAPSSYLGSALEREVWLEDDAALAFPGMKEQIEEALNVDEPLTPADEDAIASMPVEDTPRRSAPDPAAAEATRQWFARAAIAIAVLVIVWFVYRTLNHL